MDIWTDAQLATIGFRTRIRCNGHVWLAVPADAGPCQGPVADARHEFTLDRAGRALVTPPGPREGGAS
jgi:hypothetical protein